MQNCSFNFQNIHLHYIFDIIPSILSIAKLGTGLNGTFNGTPRHNIFYIYFYMLGNGIAKLGTGLNGTFNGYTYAKNTNIEQVKLFTILICKQRKERS